MARWTFQTALYPDLWRDMVGFEPCAWNGVDDETRQDQRACELWFQYPYQSENYRAGRETVGQAVHQAERKLATRLGFPVAPTYFVDVELPFPEHCQVIQLPHGYVQAIGTETRDTIEAGATVTYDGAPGPYTLDTEATVTVATGDLTDVCEVAVYHPGEVDASTITDKDESFRIYPADITLSGGNFELTFRRCDLVTWAAHVAQEGGNAIDINDDPSFLSTVDVYRRYTQPGGMTAVWRECGSECDEQTQNLCGVIQDERLSKVSFYPATYSAGVWTRQGWSRCTRPERVRVSYLAGWQAGYQRFACHRFDDLAEVIVKLSLTLMREPVCQCDQFGWLWDSARKELEVTTSTIAGTLNYFGSSMAGALDAYNWLVDHGISRGGTVTNG